jgi:NADP-dependent 3-hydroxy acid dehydrogenase YdfG
LTSSLEDRTALVTGAGGGIGGAIAAALAGRGVAVGLVGHRRPPLERVARRLGTPSHFVCEADLISDSDLRKSMRSFLGRFGRLDILVHSNGTYSSAPLDSARLRDFDRLWATNVRSVFLLTQLALPSLRASSGQIVFVNSSVGLDARAGVGQFAATQHALRALAETLRLELNPEGIRVLNVYPGRTATKRQERIFREEGREYAPERLLQPEEIAAIVVESLALPRTAEVTDIRIRPLIKP